MTSSDRLPPEETPPVISLVVERTSMATQYNALHFDRLGHTTVRIETEDGTVCYIDPWSESLEKEPHDGDIILITHDDPDHYDPEGIAAVASNDAVVGAFQLVDTDELSAEVIALPHEGTTAIGEITVKSIPAYNDPDGPHTDEEGNPFHAEGDGIGLLLTIGNDTVFFAGDTDFLEHHKSEQADVFIPPIGGHYTMDRYEAAEFARTLEPSLVLPVHYDTFEAIETDSAAFKEELEAEDIEVILF